MATLVTATLEPTLGHGVGDRRYEPVTAADLESQYDLGIGELVVDLRQVELPAGIHEVRVELGIGRALVLVPPDIGLVVSGDVSVGELELLGRDQSGIDNELRLSDEAGGETTIVLDLEVGMGKGEVSRG